MRGHFLLREDENRSAAAPGQRTKDTRRYVSMHEFSGDFIFERLGAAHSRSDAVIGSAAGSCCAATLGRRKLNASDF